jgi:outer membrane receptor for ferrienterochelin and colicins
MKLIFYLLFTLLLSANGFAQSLKGYVYEIDDKNEKIPLIGANIYWQDTQLGTTSNETGFFELKKPDTNNLNLVISYIGFKPDTLLISDEDSIEVLLSINRELNEVVITGKSLSKYIDELDPKAVEVITSKELLKAACCNLSESFTTNASVDVQFQDAVTGAKQIQLLGLAGTYTQIMFENIPTLTGIGNTFGLDYVPGPWMTAISISKGAASVVNGYESITGQINIDYKKPDHPERFYLNAFQSSHYKTDVNANFTQDISDNLSTMILAHTNFTSKTFDDNNDSFKDQPNIKQLNFLNRWNYNSYNGYDAQFGFQVINEERRGGQITEIQPLNSGNPSARYKINIDTKRFEAYAKNGYVFNSYPYTSIGLIMNAQLHEQNSLFGLRNYNAEQRSFYANLLFETQSEDEVHSVTLGGSYVFDQYKESFDQIDYNRKESRPGLFAEYNYSPANSLTIVPGARIDFHNLYGTFFTPRMHIKYSFDENTTLRISGGKGYRSVNMFADNINYLVGSRQFVVVNKPTYEEGWNYGFNLTRYFYINTREMRITADFYRTDFIKQTVVDIDSDVRQVRFYDLNGKSYSNNYQIELAYELIDNLDVTAAYRFSDVKTQFGDELLTKPLTSRYKALLTLSYATSDSKWFFDSSFLLNGNGRIPSTRDNPVEHQRKERFSEFVNINAQITHSFDFLDLYLGVENLTDFKQNNPIIAADNPFGEYFDSSLVWGPIEGRKFYIGLRLSVL